MQHSTSILYLIMGHYSLDMSLVSELLDIEHHYNHTFVFCIKESLFVQWFIDLQTKHCSKVTTLLFCKGCQVCSTLQSSLPPLPRTDWGLLSAQHSLRQPGLRLGHWHPIRGQGWPGTDQSQAGAGHGQALEPSPGAEATAHEARGWWCPNQKPQDTQRPGWAAWVMIWVDSWYGYRGCCFSILGTHKWNNIIIRIHPPPSKIFLGLKWLQTITV